MTAENSQVETISKIADILHRYYNGESLNSLDFPESSSPEIADLIHIIAEILKKTEVYSNYIESISKGNLSAPLPKSKLKIYDALMNLESTLNHLTWKTKKIASGDLNQKIEFLGEFSQAFNMMTEQLKIAFETIQLQQEELKKREMQTERDLKLAKAIQKNFLNEYVEMPEIETHVIYRPVIHVGGDIYSFIKFKDRGLLGIFIGDVNGHGIHAALVTGILKAIITSAGIIRKDPNRLLHYMNNRVIELGLDIFFTAFYGIIDTGNLTFTFSRGGHNFPFLLRNSDEPVALDCEGPLLGISRDIFIEKKSINLKSGDRILFYTDGLTECINDQGDSFENTKFIDVLKEFPDANIKDFLNHILKSLIEFRKGDSFSDDICLIGVKVL
jgi:sigma-B regulation protein RsbU (phosphoserine phosphatase)